MLADVAISSQPDGGDDRGALRVEPESGTPDRILPPAYPAAEAATALGVPLAVFGDDVIQCNEVTLRANRRKDVRARTGQKVMPKVDAARSCAT